MIQACDQLTNKNFSPVFIIITARKRSLGQGNIFSSMCQEFCSQGGGVPGQVHPLGRYTLPWAGTPPRQVHPPGRYTPWAGTPPGRYTPRANTPPRQVHPLDRYTPWAGTPPGRSPPPPGQVHPRAGTPPGAYWEIRATSGRYASYWKAFLFVP